MASASEVGERGDTCSIVVSRPQYNQGLETKSPTAQTLLKNWGH